VAALPRPPPQPLCGDSAVGREETPAALGNGEGRDGVRRKQKRCPLTSPSSVGIGTYTWRRRPALLCIEVEKKFSLNPMRSISGASVRLPCNRKGPAPLRSGLVAPTRHKGNPTAKDIWPALPIPDPSPAAPARLVEYARGNTARELCGLVNGCQTA
jgi:hypothetical protein